MEVAEVAVGLAALGTAAVSVAINHLDAARQLASLYSALQHAAEAASICNAICRSMAATACDRAPILCKLLSVGNIFPAEYQELNRSLHGCLWRTVNALADASELMYAYLQQAAVTKQKMQETGSFLSQRFLSIDSYFGLATYL